MRSFLLAVVISQFIAIAVLAGSPSPIVSGTHPSSAAPQTQVNPAAKHDETFWQKFASDPLAPLTLVLAVSTIGLWLETARIRSSQAADTRILQRAYISAEHFGINFFVSTPQLASALIRIVNTGHLPARNISWAIKQTFSNDDRLNEFSVDQTEAEGQITLTSGSDTVQGGRPFNKGTAFSKSKSGFRFIYVFGAVFYDDGFGVPRTTRFCHRYNLLNTGADGIRAQFGRRHRFGNGGD